MAEGGYKVTLNVYDLSQGLARQLSTTFLGKAIEAIWHTGVVVYDNEYYFGGGIQHSPAGSTPYGTPIRAVDLGVTHIPKEVFEDYLQEISPRYTQETYKLLGHNCNNFSNEVAQFLVGTTIPDYILQLPNEVLNSPMGPLILPMIQNLETTLRSGGVPHRPQFANPPLAVASLSSQPRTPNSTPTTNGANNKSKAPEAGNTQSSACENSVVDKPKTGAPVADPLDGARTKLQEEITREFAAIMATGNLRASEAAALATRRVMEKHGRVNTPMK